MSMSKSMPKDEIVNEEDVDIIEEGEIVTGKPVGACHPTGNSCRHCNCNNQQQQPPVTAVARKQKSNTLLTNDGDNDQPPPKAAKKTKKKKAKKVAKKAN